MTGELDLETMLETLTVSRRPGSFVVTTLESPVDVGAGVHAVVAEEEGFTVVADATIAAANGWVHDGEFAWLTLDVHSSLYAVGLTAAVADRLAAADIPCNVIAGYFHDHLLVPVGRSADAVACLSKPAEGTGRDLRSGS